MNIPFPSSVLRRVAVGIFSAVVLSAAALGETLPLDPGGSSLTFVGDSTLHKFHGEAKEFSGSAILDANATPPVQKATLHFKTASLTTFQNQRDQKMKDWLQVTVHPEAVFSLESVKLVSGDIQKANAQAPAHFAVSGTFTLNGAKHALSGAAMGWREKDRLIVTGDATIDTLQYGLPEIRLLLMTVASKVQTSYRFSFTLPAAYAQK